MKLIEGRPPTAWDSFWNTPRPGTGATRAELAAVFAMVTLPCIAVFIHAALNAYG